jgi:hypothetical protein
METQKKYRIHAINHDIYGKGAEARFVVQKKGFLGIWYNISDEMSDEAYANKVCETFNKYNC